MARYGSDADGGVFVKCYFASSSSSLIRVSWLWIVKSLSFDLGQCIDGHFFLLASSRRMMIVTAPIIISRAIWAFGRPWQAHTCHQTENNKPTRCPEILTNYLCFGHFPLRRQGSNWVSRLNNRPTRNDGRRQQQQTNNKIHNNKIISGKQFRNFTSATQHTHVVEHV